LVTLYDVGEAEGRIYLAMELVDGRSLSAVLDEGPLPVDEAIGLARQVLQGLNKAHAAGLVHRDLQPDNIMITSDGVVKVLDFGLAKVLERDLSKSALGSAETV